MSLSILPAPNSSSSLSSVHYSLDMIRDEVRQLVEKGLVSRYQPIYTICQYIHPREWVCFECELECPSKAIDVHPFKEELPPTIEYGVRLK